MTARQGRVRLARLTDLAALGELSRLSDPSGSEEADHAVRSLGLPVQSAHVSVFSLFRMPLGALQPHDPLYVYEEGGHLAGLARVERDGGRDEWTLVELDALDDGAAGDIRFRLVGHLLRDGAKRGAARIHVACADADGNVELLMQAGFVRYAEEAILFRDVALAYPDEPPDDVAALAGIRPARRQDAVALHALHRAVTPLPVARLEGYRMGDWERLAGGGPIPRSALTPILRFTDLEAWVQERDGATGSRDELAGFVQVGVAKEDQPHYLRIVARPDHDPVALIRYGLGVIGARTRDGGRRTAGSRGVLAAIRTYEAPLDRRLEDAGFRHLSRVTILLKESLVRVAQPSLVPAVR